MIKIPKNIKELFSKDNVPKRIIVSFPNEDRPNIENDQILSESLSFTESICSQIPMKLGLCEASQISFVCYGIENIEGKVISVDIEVRTEDGEWYPISLGLYTVSTCKRDAQDYNKRQVDAYSLIASQNWSIPRSILALKRYTWRAAQTLNFSGQDFIDLINPINHYTRNKENMQRPTEVDILERFTSISSNDEYCVIDIYGISKNFYSVPDVPQGIVSVRANYPRNEITQYFDEISEDLWERGFSFDFRRTLSLENVSPKFVGHKKYNTYGSWTIDGDVFGGLNKQAFDIPIRPNGEVQTFLLLDGSYSSGNTRACNDYAIVYDDENKKYYLPPNTETVCPPVRVPTYIEYSVYASDRTKRIHYERFDISDSYIEYCATPLGQGARMLQIKSKLEPNNRVYKINFDGSASFTKTKRNDYSFSEAIALYFEDYDVRSYIEAYCETMGGFGKFNRNGLFEIVYLKTGTSIYPQEDLFPSMTLYPSEDVSDLAIRKSMYSKCYVSDEDTKLYSKVTCTYKNTDDEEEYAEYILIDTSNDMTGKSENDSSAYLTYDISDNLLVKMNRYTEAQMNTILARIGERIRRVVYRPFDIEMLGHPEAEAGDLIRVSTDANEFSSYILRRQMKGIQLLIDSITTD